MRNNQNSRPKMMKAAKPTKIQVCEKCRALPLTPDFVAMIAQQYNRPTSAVPEWYHQHGHQL